MFRNVLKQAAFKVFSEVSRQINCRAAPPPPRRLERFYHSRENPREDMVSACVKLAKSFPLDVVKKTGLNIKKPILPSFYDKLWAKPSPIIAAYVDAAFNGMRYRFH